MKQFILPISILLIFIIIIILFADIKRSKSVVLETQIIEQITLLFPSTFSEKGSNFYFSGSIVTSQDSFYEFDPLSLNSDSWAAYKDGVTYSIHKIPIIPVEINVSTEQVEGHRLALFKLLEICAKTEKKSGCFSFENDRAFLDIFISDKLIWVSELNIRGEHYFEPSQFDKIASAFHDSVLKKYKPISNRDFDSLINDLKPIKEINRLSDVEADLERNSIVTELKQKLDSSEILNKDLNKTNADLMVINKDLGQTNLELRSINKGIKSEYKKIEEANIHLRSSNEDLLKQINEYNINRSSEKFVENYLTLTTTNNKIEQFIGLFEDVLLFHFGTENKLRSTVKKEELEYHRNYPNREMKLLGVDTRLENEAIHIIYNVRVKKWDRKRKLEKNFYSIEMVVNQQSGKIAGMKRLKEW